MSQRRNVRQTVRRVGIQIPQVSELIRRRSFNTTFSAIATLVTWKCFQALWFRWFYNIISKHPAVISLASFSLNRNFPSSKTGLDIVEIIFHEHCRRKLFNEKTYQVTLPLILLLLLTLPSHSQWPPKRSNSQYYQFSRKISDEKKEEERE